MVDQCKESRAEKQIQEAISNKYLMEPASLMHLDHVLPQELSGRDSSRKQTAVHADSLYDILSKSIQGDTMISDCQFRARQKWEPLCVNQHVSSSQSRQPRDDCAMNFDPVQTQ